MQDRYAGDVGDYVKFAILRALSPGRRVGVAWWLYPDESHNGDGRHTAYLDKPDQWRAFDPEVFDHLARLRASGARTVAALEPLLPDAAFARRPMPTEGAAGQLRHARTAWFDEMAEQLASCDLVFLDPDNGLEPRSFTPGSRRAGKSVAVEEVLALRKPGRSLLIYHHQTRMAGGQDAEAAHWRDRLRAAGVSSVDVLRASAFSSRFFFLLDADEELRRRAAAVAERWGRYLSWRPETAAASLPTEVGATDPVRDLLLRAAEAADPAERGALIEAAARANARGLTRPLRRAQKRPPSEALGGRS